MLRKPEHGIHRPARGAGLRMTRDEVVSKESALIREIRGAEVFRQQHCHPERSRGTLRSVPAPLVGGAHQSS